MDVRKIRKEFQVKDISGYTTILLQGTHIAIEVSWMSRIWMIPGTMGKTEIRVKKVSPRSFAEEAFLSFCESTVQTAS